jgi:hypothetical protein
MNLKRRNPFVAAWLTYPALRRLGCFNRWICLRLALSHFYSPLVAQKEADNGS